MHALREICSGRKRLIALTAIVSVLASGLAYAYFTTSSASGSNGQSRAGSLQPPTAVSATASGSTVSVSWTASATSASSPAPQGYYVTRTNQSTQVTSPACGSSASNPIAGSTSCSDPSVPNGAYTYAVTAVFNAWTAGASSSSVTVNGTPPSITLTPTSAHVGDAVSLSGSNFPANTSVSVTYDGAPVGLSPGTTTNSSGSFSAASFTVPVSVGGPHIVAVSAGGNTATATLTVTPSISLSPSSGPVGNTVTISGSGFAAGQTLTATFGGGSVSLAGTTTTSSDGRFGGASFTVPSGGGGTVTVVDHSGNSASTGFTAGTGPSLALSPTSAAAGAGTPVTISGSSYAANATIAATFDGQNAPVTPAGAKTNAGGTIPSGVRFSVPTTSGSGAHTVRVTAGGQAGTATFTLTPAAATSPTVVDGAGATTTITGTNQGAVNVKVTLPATALASDVVHVSLTDGTHTTADATAAATQGGGTVTVSGIDARGLNDGSTTVNASVRDSLGDSSTTTTGTTTKTIAPTGVQLVDGSGNALTAINMLNRSSTNVKVALPTGARGGDVVHVTLTDGTHTTADQTGTIPANNATSVTVGGIDASALNDGSNNVTISATLAFPTSAGTGTSAAKTATTSKDTVPPSVSSIADATGSPTNHTSVAWTVTFSGSVTGVDSSDFQVATTGNVGAPTVSGVSGSGASYTVTVNNISPAGNGTVGLNLVDNDSILDAAGNPLGGPGISGTPGDGGFIGQSYTIDTITPAAPVIASPANNSLSSPTVTLSGTAEPNSSVQIYEGSTTQGTAVSANAAGSWTKQLTAVAGGSHTYTAKATDAAGNTSGSSNAVTIQVDATAPTVSASTIAKTEGLPDSTAGSIRQGGTYYVYAQVADTGGSGVATVTADVSAVSGSGATSVLLHPCQSNCTVNGTSYSYVSDQQTASNPLTAGSATYVITATDGVGNQGNSGTGGQAKSVAVDDTAPTIASISTKNGGATAGVIEKGDSITFAYSAPIDGVAILTTWTWNWTATQNVEVKVIDGGAANDTMQILSADGSSVLPFGTVDLGSKNYITTGGFAILGTGVAPSTMTRATSQQDPFTITFGAPNTAASTGTLATTAVTQDTITWSPGFPNAAYDAAGNILSNGPSSVTNNGTGSSKTQF